VNITHRLRKVQYESCQGKITSFAGLKHITDLAHRLGILKALNGVTVKKRRRGIPIPDFVMSVVQTVIAGGSHLSDLEVLRSEGGTRKVLYDLETPAPTTAGERIRTFSLGHIKQLESAITKGLLRLSDLAGLRGPVTLDGDSSMFEVHGYLKEGARYGYTGEKGLHPLLAFWAETRLLLGVRLRSGNRHTADGAVSFLREVLSRIPQSLRVNLRLDAGFYNRDVSGFAEQRGLGFSISARLTSALMKRIDARPDESWRTYPWQEDTEWTEFSYKPQRWKRPYRLIVKRQPYYKETQRILGEYFYTAVITNRRGAGSSLMRHHLARGGMENYIEEFKNGFGARHLPSQKFLANWTWLTLVMLAYNLVQAFKLLVLPARDHALQIKALRLHWFCVAARIVRSGRKTRLALARGPDVADLFTSAQASVHALR
jgi:hypothetical protein